MRYAILLLVVGTSAAAQDFSQFTRWVWDGIYTAQQAKRGEPLYRTYCGDCHGPDLEGRTDFPPPPPDPPPNIVMVGRFKPGSPPLKGATFISNWTDLSLGDLYERIRISMPQNAPGSLSRQQNADILAYLLQENGFRTGNEWLPTDKATLDTIRFGR